MTGQRFTKDASGIITDSQTNLQWFCTRGGGDISWYDADASAKGLSIGGGGWTLASRDQLRGLRGEGHSSGLFSPDYSWSSEQGPTSAEAWNGDYSRAWLVYIWAEDEFVAPRNAYAGGLCRSSPQIMRILTSNQSDATKLEQEDPWPEAARTVGYTRLFR